MKKNYFSITLIVAIILLCIGYFSYANTDSNSIIIYDSKGNQTVTNYQFPDKGRETLNFSDPDEGQRSKQIQSISEFLMNFTELPFSLKKDRVHSLNFQSIIEMNRNTFAIRFTYDFDLSKINSRFPKRIALISKNILVRVKNGYIESISTGIENEFLERTHKKISDLKKILSQNLKSQIMQNSINNFIAFIKQEKQIYYPILIQYIKDHKMDLIQYIQHSSKVSVLELSQHFKELLFSLKNCDAICKKDKIEKVLSSINLKKENLDQWLTSQINRTDLLKMILQDLSNKGLAHFHLDSQDNLHLILEFPAVDFIKVDLAFTSDGIQFKKIKQLSHLNDFKFFETPSVTSVANINVFNLKTETITSESLNSLTDQFQNKLLSNEKDYIALYLLYNQQYYKDKLSYERSFGNKSLPVHYGITSNASAADTIAWAYSPLSKFIIGAGGTKFKGQGFSASTMGHEFFHSVEENLSNLYSINEPGALKEHGGDIMGMIIADQLRKKEEESSSFTIGCNIFTPDSIKSYKERQVQITAEKNNESSTGSPICLRNFLDPKKSFAKQAVDKKSIEDFLGPNYQTDCEDDFSNDSCGIHFQASIPNLVVSQFMLDAKKNFASLKWNDIRNLTAKILFNTYAGRLQSDAGFLTYGQQLKLECLDQAQSLLLQPDASVALCNQLEDKFIEILK